MAARGATSTQWWHLLAPSTLHGYQIQRDPDPRSLDVPAYLRLLDADAAGADWRGVARIVLHIDPELESGRELWTPFDLPLTSVHSFQVVDSWRCCVRSFEDEDAICKYPARRQPARAFNPVLRCRA